ncbi:MAG: hypothetical protein U0736_17700 [Gemmataceae bacterium]
MTELGNAILATSQGFSIQGVTGPNASTDGSEAFDAGLLPASTPNPPLAPSLIDVPVN